MAVPLYWMHHIGTPGGNPSDKGWLPGNMTAPALLVNYIHTNVVFIHISSCEPVRPSLETVVIIIPYAFGTAFAVLLA